MIKNLATYKKNGFQKISNVKILMFTSITQNKYFNKMEVVLKNICLCIFVTSINGIENTPEFHVNEPLKDYDYLKDSSTPKEIYAKFNLKLKELHYDFNEGLKNLKMKTLELENENLKLKERLSETEENLKNYKVGFERIEEDQKETKEIFKKMEIRFDYSEKHLMKIEGELKDTKVSLKKTNDGLQNSEEDLKRIGIEQREMKEIFGKSNADLNDLKADLEENKERAEKSEEGLKKLVEEVIKVTKEELKKSIKLFNSMGEELKVIKEELIKTSDNLRLKNLNERNEILNFVFNNKVSNFLNNKNLSHYHLFTDINGKNKAFIIPLDGMKLKTFNNSVNLCKNFNSTLIEIDSKEKQLILESFLGRLGNEFLSNQYKYFWINCERDSSGVWKWLKSNTQLTFTNWATNNPNTNSSYNNTSVGISFGNTGVVGIWYNIEKNWYSYVMCEHSFPFL